MKNLQNAMLARQWLAELENVSTSSTAFKVKSESIDVVVKLQKPVHGMVASLARANGIFNADWCRAAIKEKLERDLHDIVVEGEADPAEGVELE